MVLHTRVVGITMEGLDHRMKPPRSGARTLSDDALIRAHARQMVSHHPDGGVDRNRDAEKMTLEPETETPLPLLDIDRFERDIERLRSDLSVGRPLPAHRDR